MLAGAWRYRLVNGANCGVAQRFATSFSWVVGTILWRNRELRCGFMWNIPAIAGACR